MKQLLVFFFCLFSGVAFSQGRVLHAQRANVVAPVNNTDVFIVYDHETLKYDVFVKTTDNTTPESDSVIVTSSGERYKRYRTTSSTLSSVDWGSITGKPSTFTPASHTQAISTITGLQTALDAKQATISAGTTSQYRRGDNTWQTLDKAAVGLNNVPNVDATIATNLTSGTIPSGRYGTATIPYAAIQDAPSMSVSALRLASPTYTSVTITDKYKRGLFFYDASSSASDDGALVIVTANGRRYRRFIPDNRYSASWWVTSLTDTLSDVSALSAAIAALPANSTLVLNTDAPTEKYYIKSNLSIAKSNVKIAGEGRFGAVEVAPGTVLSEAITIQGFDVTFEGIQFTANANARKILNFVGNGSRPTVHGCYFLGHSSKPTGQIAINLNGSTTPAVYLASIAHCHFNYFEKGIVIENEANGMFYDLHFDRPKWAMWVSNNGGLIDVFGTFVQTPDSAGVYTDANANKYDLIVETTSGVPGIKFDTSASYNFVTGIMQSGAGPAVVDLGLQNLGYVDRGYTTLFQQLKPVYDIYVPNGSIFLDLGNANKLSLKKLNGSVVVLEP